MINLPLVEHCPTPMAVLNKNKELLVTSRGWDVLFKHPIVVNSNEIHFSHLLPPSLEHTRSALLNYIPGQKLNGEDSYVDQQGCLKWISYQIYDTPEQIILNLQDISLQKENQNNQYFRDILEKNAQIGSWQYDIENDVLQWSPITKSIFEVAQDYRPSLEESFLFFKQGQHLEQALNAINQIISTGEPFELELQIRTNTEREKWVCFSGGKAKHYSESNIIYGTIQDINKQKNTALRIALQEKQLKSTKRSMQENKRLFTSIFNSTFQFTGFLNLKGRLIDVNEPALKFAGIELEDALNKYFWDTYWWQNSKKERNKLKKNIAKAAKGKFVRYEAKILDKNQIPIYIDFSLKPVLDENKQVVFLISEGRVIQEMVEARKKLSESEKLHRMLLELSPTGLVLNDAMSGEFMEMNGSFKRSIGYIEKEFRALRHPDVIPKAHKTKELRVLKEVLENGICGPYQGEYLHKSGASVPSLITRVLITNHDGRKLIWSVVQDITQLQEKEAELLELINVASEQNNRLLNFAHIVSHNLRSHASNFSMLIELLGIEEDIFKKVEIMEMLNTASKNMLDTIANLNEIIAINTNLNIKTEVVNIRHEINEAFTNISELTKSAFAEIEINVPEQVQINVVKAYLESILLNIFTNAIKYKSPKRYPKITIDYENTKGYSIITISDNGIGIDLKKHGHKLFGMYKTFHGNRDARGIGLFITKNQIEAMKGKIEVESNVDQGTKFKIYFYENY
ncbi:PAS domain S-box protein [Galbibacter sp.]|uniref:PAS domain-containing sensor histidine kinase n=1 Tax=Galbibacter sp. TaxID=2918471 RepID=UPI003A938E2C